ncbi:MAG: hypothetical protein ABI067_17895 [Leifsonia sp.]
MVIPDDVMMSAGEHLQSPQEGLPYACALVIARWAYDKALHDAENALDSLDGSRATGYYASEAHSGYQEAQRDMETALADLRSGTAKEAD